jgi:hypothetical protein
LLETVVGVGVGGCGGVGAEQWVSAKAGKRVTVGLYQSGDPISG